MKLLRLTEFVVESTEPGSWSDDGTNFVPGATSTRTILGTMQPLPGIEIQQLPEGFRDRMAFKFYTAEALFPMMKEASKPADVVLVDIGEGPLRFEVLSCAPWLSPSYAGSYGSGKLDHFKIILVRQNEQ